MQKLGNAVQKPHTSARNGNVAHTPVNIDRQAVRRLPQ